MVVVGVCFFFFKQKTAYEMRISDWSSDVCSSDLPEQKAWIQERIEGIRNQTHFTDKGKRAILERLTAAETFERFLDRKYTGTKQIGRASCRERVCQYV